METTDRTAFPGLTKIRRVPLLQRRCVELCTISEGRWRDILEAADVVSEGSARLEGAALVYYGSTSVLLPRRSAGGVLPDVDVTALASVLRLDPHVRLRALRIARREAQSRAGAPMRTVLADMQVTEAPRGVVIAVDVSAHLMRPSRCAPPALPRAASALQEPR